jgi:acyl carrier protein
MDSDPAAGVRAEISAAVTQEFAAVLDLPVTAVGADADFYSALDGVSQQKLELLARLEDRFSTTITDEEAADLHTVRDFAGLLTSKLQP